MFNQSAKKLDPARWMGLLPTQGATQQSVDCVSLEGAEAEVPLEVSDLWVVPIRATGDGDVGDVYGVASEDEDEATSEEDLDRAGEVASSSTFDTPNLIALPSTSAPSGIPPSQVVFKYDVDEAVLLWAMERGKLHERTNVEFHAICMKHGLSVRGAKGDLIMAHFQ